MIPQLPPDRADKGLFWAEAWTLVDGCTPVSAGCKNCWAAAMAHRFGRKGFEWTCIDDGKWRRLTTTQGKWTGDIYLNHKALSKPSKRREATVYAIWNDLFNPDVDEDFVIQVWGVMRQNPRHTFIIITKRPMWATLFARDYHLEPLPNVWFMATTENQACLDERASWVIDFPAAAVKGVILEPLLDLVQIPPKTLRQLGWLIIGMETGPHRRHCPLGSDMATIRSIVHQCQAAEVPVWVKAIEVDDRIVKKTNELPEDVRFRELPGVRS